MDCCPELLPTDHRVRRTAADPETLEFAERFLQRRMDDANAGWSPPPPWAGLKAADLRTGRGRRTDGEDAAQWARRQRELLGASRESEPWMKGAADALAAGRVGFHLLCCGDTAFRGGLFRPDSDPSSLLRGAAAEGGGGGGGRPAGGQASGQASGLSMGLRHVAALAFGFSKSVGAGSLGQLRVAITVDSPDSEVACLSALAAQGFFGLARENVRLLVAPCLEGFSWSGKRQTFVPLPGTKRRPAGSGLALLQARARALILIPIMIMIMILILIRPGAAAAGAGGAGQRAGGGGGRSGGAIRPAGAVRSGLARLRGRGLAGHLPCGRLRVARPGRLPRHRGSGVDHARRRHRGRRLLHARRAAA